MASPATCGPRPPASPIEPVELGPDSRFRFGCHPGIACFNACCRDIDITLTPYDIVRLKRRLGLASKEFVAGYTIPFEMDAHGMPGLKLRAKPGTTECAFLTERGCSVYTDRPVSCRYYALGSIGVRRKDVARVDDVWFVVREPHCLGHDEPREQTVAEYREEQGVERYDEMNRAWRDIVLKKRSSGPTVGAPSPRSLQLFDMCSYDTDSFREFVRTDGFREVFDIDDSEVADILSDDERLLAFSMQFLKQVLFGETTIPVRRDARKRRMEKRRETWTARREEAAVRHREDQERRRYGDRGADPRRGSQ